MKKETRKKLSLFIFVLLFIFVSQFWPIKMFAADVFLFSANQELADDGVIVSLGVDTGPDKINAITGELTYDQSILELVTISNANSIVPLWVESPVSKIPGIIYFSGVIPGGFGGQGKIISLIFKSKVEGHNVIKNVKIKTIEILRNDGLGTIVEANLVSPKQETIRALDISSSVDNNKPELFRPILRKNDPLFEGKSYLLFNTTDKGSGVDKYFVSEGTSWQEATSPYLLLDQNIARHIYVKAVDRAGNSLIVEVDQGKKFYQFWWFWVIIIVALIGVCFWCKRKFL